MSELKGCPWCGVRAQILKFAGSSLWSVGCFETSCEVQPKTQSAVTFDLAVKNWNTRFYAELPRLIVDLSNELDLKDEWSE